MKNGLVLERQSFTSKSTQGAFYFNGDFICHSLERPWVDNEPFVSCVPVGEYSFTPHKYKGKLDTVALIGDTVSHYPSDKARNLILIHPANHPHELHGCISTGLKKDVDVVYRSKNAFGLLIDVINTNRIDTITII